MNTEQIRKRGKELSILFINGEISLWDITDILVKEIENDR